MKEDERRIELRSEGIFMIGEKKLDLRSLRRKRTRLEGLILDLQNSQRYHTREIKSHTKEIQRLERELATFNSPAVINWMEQREQELALDREQKRLEKIEAERRAHVFLKEYIGEEAFNQLNKKGYFNFEGQDHRSYRINKKGGLYRNGKKLCMIHPKDLPLPDFIAAILTTMKEVGRRT